MTDSVSERTSTTSAENLDDAANLRDPDQEDASLLDSALGVGDGDPDDVDDAGLSLLEDPQIDDPVRSSTYGFEGRDERLAFALSCRKSKQSKPASKKWRRRRKS